MTTMDQLKMQAIHFTFKQVSKYFSDIFKKIVPGGRAILVMKSVNDRNGSEIEPQDLQEDNFIGVGIQVSFTNSEAAMKELNQLSGGQKSLIAITLIFAIQKCDPAPFYFFDEIDQALDSEHRKAFADIIREASTTTQFITTTFRPELLQYANKFYGVTFKNKVSNIKCIHQDDAQKFITCSTEL